MNSNNKNINEDQLMTYLANEADQQLVKDVEAWIAYSPDNEKVFKEIEKAWIESEKVSIKPVYVNTDAAWEKLSTKIDSSEKNKIYPKSEMQKIKSFSWTLLRIAAVLILVTGVWLIIRFADNPPEDLKLISNNDQIIEILPDGSKVNLNIHSILIYPEEFKKNTREVELTGEAFFEIEPDKEKAFIIHAGNANIKVVGTSFNVKALSESDEVEVSVQTGVVQLYSHRPDFNDTISVILNVGERGIFNNKSIEIKKIESFDYNELYWSNKTLVFEDTELSKVFEMLKKYYNVHITLQFESVSNCRLNATFTNETIDEILKVIAISFDLELFKTGEQNYTLNGEGC